MKTSTQPDPVPSDTHHSCGPALVGASVSPFIPPKPHSLVLHIGAYFLCLVVLESNDFLKSVPLYNIRFNMYYFKGILQILIYQYWQFNMLILTFVHLKLLILAEKMTNKIEYIMLL